MQKSLRPSQIIASERNVQKIIRVLQEEYVNPFAIDLESTQLINLSSGVPLPDDLSTNILNIRQIGLTKFRDQRLRSKNVLFHSSVVRNKFSTFTDNVKSNVVKKGNARSEYESQQKHHLLTSLVLNKIKQSVRLEKYTEVSFVTNSVKYCNRR